MPVFYVYNVTEKTGTQPSNGTIAYSGQTYQMTVYVTYTGGSLAVTAVEFRVVTGNTPGAKADPIFENIYTESTSLTIGKTVAGTYADPTKPFSYSLTLTAAAGVTAATYTGTILDSSSSPIGTVTFTLAGSPLTATNTFTLSDGQTLVFDGANGSTVLPVGTTYTLTETGAGGYIPSVVLSADSIVTGTTTITPTTPVVGDSLTITDAILADSANTADFTNPYNDVSPTGILMNNLPFIYTADFGSAGRPGALPCAETPQSA